MSYWGYYYNTASRAHNIILIVSILAKCCLGASFYHSKLCNSCSFIGRSCGIIKAPPSVELGKHYYKSYSAAAAAADTNNNDISSNDVPDMSDVGFVLLAGGTGSRMKATMPKQFLTLRGKPVLHHSMDLFLEQLPAFLKSRGKGCPPQVILVMDPMYQPEYQKFIDQYKGRLKFASPGKERQGSVENGLNVLKTSSADVQYVAIHDSARPLVTIQEVCDVVTDAKEVGAAVLGVPCKATIKESEDGVLVTRTIPRSRLWEVHTPQVIRIDMLYEGFQKVEENNWEVTDDVSIIELLGKPVKITKGEYTNLKITTPEDMDVAEAILEDRHEKKKLLASQQV